MSGGGSKRGGRRASAVVRSVRIKPSRGNPGGGGCDGTLAPTGAAPAPTGNPSVRGMVECRNSHSTHSAPLPSPPPPSPPPPPSSADSMATVSFAELSASVGIDHPHSRRDLPQCASTTCNCALVHQLPPQRSFFLRAPWSTSRHNQSVGPHDEALRRHTQHFVPPPRISDVGRRRRND